MDTIGRYRVVRPLGHGGMGDVYLAHDPTLERNVAIKLLHREPTRTSLRDEARALAALSHPNIVTVFEIGEHEHHDFIAMEYLPGRSLREVLASGARAREELLAICAAVARAVDAAHAAGILHRDIKPENVVVAEGGGIKVVDFGLARRLEHADRPTSRPVTANEVIEVFRRTIPPDSTLGGVDTEVSAGTQTMFGTPAYMAPEVLLGEPSTKASDIYALGVTIYECLTGHRPYTATSLLEVIAQTIDGPPPPLADPLGPLVDRMLARDPALRPSLAEVSRGLTRTATVPAPPPPRRSARLVAAVAVAGSVAVGSWVLARRQASPPPVTASVAIAPFSFDVKGYGVEPPHAGAIAEVLSRLVGEVRGAHLIATTTGSSDAGVTGTYLVHGTIATSRGELRATLDVVELATHTRVATHVIERPAADFPLLLDDVADEIARAIAPGAALDRAPNTMRAQMFARLGGPVLEAGHFTEARPYFEQAVDADPTMFDGWYELGLVLAWMDASDAEVRVATEHALVLAPPGPKHELVRGVSAFVAGDTSRARAILEPLESVTGPGAPDPRELYYYLGEANWHDGRHAAAFAYFEKVLKRDPRFKPATVHAWQYAVVHQDVAAARYYVGLAGDTDDWAEHAAGNYAALATSGTRQHALEAKLVLGQLDGPELAEKLAATDLDGASYQVAVAIARGDRTAAKTAFATAWARATANPDPDSVIYALDNLGEVVLSADLTDEARTIVAFLAAHSKQRPARNYLRFSILAAQLAHDPTLIIRDHASERMRSLADAIASSLAGDRTAAATGLRALVDDPTFSYDYPERAALLRELVAGDNDASTLCAALAAPPIVHPAMLVLRAECQRTVDGPR